MDLYPKDTAHGVEQAIIDAIQALPVDGVVEAVEHSQAAATLLGAAAAGSAGMTEIYQRLHSGNEAGVASYGALETARQHLETYLAGLGFGRTAEAQGGPVIGTASAQPQSPVTAPADAPKGHEPCIYVSREIGSGPDADAALLRDIPGVAFEIALSMVKERDRLENHHKLLGSLAMSDVQCETCRIANDCRVREYLTGFSRIEEIGVAAREPQDIPWVITFGRLQRIRDIPPLTQLASDLRMIHRQPEGTETVEIDVQKVRESRGGISLDRTAKPPQYKGEDLPEIIPFAAIEPDATFIGTPLTTEAGHRFEFVDASNAIHFKGPQPSENELAVLCGKFLGRMVEVGPDGRPLLLAPDNTMQKVISTLPGGAVLCEMRMSGKNRLYFTVVQSAPDEPVRVVFLGAHGGDAGTQRDFINVALRRR